MTFVIANDVIAIKSSVELANQIADRSTRLEVLNDFMLTYLTLPITNINDIYAH